MEHRFHLTSCDPQVCVNIIPKEGEEEKLATIMERVEVQKSVSEIIVFVHNYCKENNYSQELFHDYVDLLIDVYVRDVAYLQYLQKYLVFMCTEKNLYLSCKSIKSYMLENSKELHRVLTLGLQIIMKNFNLDEKFLINEVSLINFPSEFEFVGKFSINEINLKTNGNTKIHFSHLPHSTLYFGYPSSNTIDKNTNLVIQVKMTQFFLLK